MVDLDNSELRVRLAPGPPHEDKDGNVESHLHVCILIVCVGKQLRTDVPVGVDEHLDESRGVLLDTFSRRSIKKLVM